MTVANRIKVVLLDSGEITQFGLGRVAEFASEVVVVGERRRSHVVEQLQALGVNVTVEEGKADIDSAILAAARSGAVVVVTGRPAKAEAFVKRAAHGAANAVDHGLPVVGVYVLGEHETRPGKVFTVTETGEMSGYEALFAAALAEQLGREVVAVSPPGRIRAARTVSEHPALGGAENLHQRAHEIAAGAGVKWTERSDPSPVNFVTEESGSAAVIIIGVLDVPAGSKWLGSRPKVNEGNPRAAASLVGGAPSDVMVVFDGVQLTHENLSKDQAAAILGLGLVATGAAAAVATPASAMLGHVTRSITQQARTYRADIGSSDSDGPSASSKSAQDSKDSDTSSGESSRAGSSSKKAPKTSIAASTVHSSTRSGTAETGSGPSDSPTNGKTTLSASTVHTSRSTAVQSDRSNHPAPAPRPDNQGDGLRDGIGGHGAWGHSCDRGHSSHCGHLTEPSGGTSTPGTGTPGTGTPAQPSGGTPPTGQTPHQAPQPGQQTPTPLPQQVPTPVPHQVPQPEQQTPTPVTTPQQEPGQTPTAVPQQVPQVPQPEQKVPTLQPGVPTPTATPHQVPTAIPQPTQQIPTLQPGVPTPTATPHQVPTAIPQPTQQIPTLQPGVPTPTATPHQVPTAIPQPTQQIPTLQPGVPTPTATPHQVPTAIPQQVPGQVPTATQQVPGQVPTAVPQPGQKTPTPMATPQQVSNQTPAGQVPTGTPIGAGGYVPQPGNTDIPWSTLRAQTNSGAQTPGAGVVPGDSVSMTPASVLSAQHNVGEQPTHTAPAALGSEQGAPPEGELAHTGADGVGLLAGMAASLVAAGSGLVLAGRRKKDDEDEEPDAAG